MSLRERCIPGVLKDKKGADDFKVWGMEILRKDYRSDVGRD
ncbi:MAG: hypothetical protein R3351_00970 [Nitrospirales bacterium]|nr:hypothetical protein [Nitrospirales bacterium]